MERAGAIFPYQRILDWKEQQERALQLEIARLERAILALRRERARWTALREETFDRFREARAKAELDVADQYPRYLEHLRDQVRRCTDKIRELQEDKEKVRKEIERVMQSRKLLEQFKERKLKQYWAEQEQGEQRALDAYSIERFIRGEAAP